MTCFKTTIVLSKTKNKQQSTTAFLFGRSQKKEDTCSSDPEREIRERIKRIKAKKQSILEQNDSQKRLASPLLLLLLLLPFFAFSKAFRLCVVVPLIHS